MEINIIAILIASFVPLVLGFVWYHPNVFGEAWKNAAGVNVERMAPGRMALTFGLTFLLSFLIAFALQSLVIHQFHMASILMNEPGLFDPSTEIGKFYKDFIAQHGNNFRTFKHGALHGTIAGFTIALPILGINALFERKSFKYVAINAGYWIVLLCLMGGIICSMR